MKFMIDERKEKGREADEWLGCDRITAFGSLKLILERQSYFPSFPPVSAKPYPSN